MQLTPTIPTIDEKPANMTALSLVFFLLASLLSMMAAYDTGRPPDDLRNSVVITLHENAAPSSDSNPDDAPLAVALARAFWLFEAAPGCGRLVYVAFTPFTASPFDARGPPARRVFLA